MDRRGETLLGYFNDISQIPRKSGNEKGISDYLKGFFEKRGCRVVQDKWFNLYVQVPSETGTPSILLQGHMDMVCEKDDGVDHDFSKDPIQTVVEGNIMRARGTTLGADNGVAVIMMMALLDEKNLPGLEFLITSDEETGMSGARNFDYSHIQARRVINLDSEEEGVLTIACAGGGRIRLKIPVEWEGKKYRHNGKIRVGGLKGGHSGVDIHLGRGNANKILGRVLRELGDTCGVASIQGGSSDNAIPRSAEAVVGCDDLSRVRDILQDMEDKINREFRFSESSITITLEEAETPETFYTWKTFEKILGALSLIESQPIVVNPEIDAVVHSNNLGVLREEGHTMLITCAPRSSSESLLEDFCQKMDILGSLLGAEVSKEAFYPGWDYSGEGDLEKAYKASFRELAGKEPVTMAIHAGLECGYFSKNLPGADIVSFGPNLYDVHTPKERLEVDSLERTYELLVHMLGALS